MEYTDLSPSKKVKVGTFLTIIMGNLPPSLNQRLTAYTWIQESFDFLLLIYPNPTVGLRYTVRRLAKCAPFLNQLNPGK